MIVASSKEVILCLGERQKRIGDNRQARLSISEAKLVCD